MTTNTGSTIRKGPEMNIRVKSVYDKREPADGYKVLVDDFLPLSMNEKMAEVDLWMRGLTPGDELKKLLDKMPGSWEAFRDAYFRELDDDKGHLVEIISELAGEDGITLFFSSSDPEHNVAVAVRDYILARHDAQFKKAA